MIRILLSLAALTFAACATPAHSGDPTSSHHTSPHDEPRPFVTHDHAAADLEATLAAARESGKNPLIVMGANWCHDSRGLAAHFEKDRFQSMIRAHYELLYIDVGQKDRNIDIVQQLGVDAIVGTPTVFVLSPDGEVLNLDTAPTWRNAASRSEDEVFEYFRSFAHARYGD